jgi:hypothetical protein
MTEKDKNLIEQAKRFSSTEWHKADLLAEQAETSEARETLHDISKRLYHREEAFAELL